MKKILMLTTGGTIASLPSEEGLAPTGADTILSHMGPSAANYDITTQEILTLDSTNIQPEAWKIIAGAIYQNIRLYDGIVVTHGTDTMAYTASMMSFMLRNVPIPVVFTGSQVPIASPLSDAPLNLTCAFAMAASATPGIFVGFDRKFAVRFSFLLSIPAVLGANILTLKDAIQENSIIVSDIPVYLVGVAVAAVVGYICIRLLKIIADTGKFGWFAYYCWAVGLIVLALTLVLK